MKKSKPINFEMLSSKDALIIGWLGNGLDQQIFGIWGQFTLNPCHHKIKLSFVGRHSTQKGVFNFYLLACNIRMSKVAVFLVALFVVGLCNVEDKSVGKSDRYR